MSIPKLIKNWINGSEKEAINNKTFKKLNPSNGEIVTDEVGFGNKVSVLEEGKDEPEDYYLLGPIESELDLYPMVVTYHAPFAQAMIGKKINEEFTIDISDEDVKFTIIAIEKITANTPKCNEK